MATDPVPALMSLAKERPDPRAITNWIVAYLGKRSAAEKSEALKKLERAFDGRTGAPEELRAAGLVLRVVRRLQADAK